MTVAAPSWRLWIDEYFARLRSWPLNKNPSIWTLQKPDSSRKGLCGNDDVTDCCGTHNMLLLFFCKVHRHVSPESYFVSAYPIPLFTHCYYGLAARWCQNSLLLLPPTSFRFQSSESEFWTSNLSRRKWNILHKINVFLKLQIAASPVFMGEESRKQLFYECAIFKGNMPRWTSSYAKKSYDPTCFHLRALIVFTLRSVFPLKCSEYCNKAALCKGRKKT